MEDILFQLDVNVMKYCLLNSQLVYRNAVLAFVAVHKNPKDEVQLNALFLLRLS